ncbi:MAG: avidin/streptavidin family protein [Devosia sp.]|nr:avidin/streptavidin family protein [Devosia sp.]
MTVAKSSLLRLAAQGLAPPNMLGVWNNELGSIMTINAVNGSTFSGTYDSDDGHGGRIVGDLTGIVAGETIGWSVSWQPGADSTTSWAGKFLTSGGKIYIYTLWYLSGGDAALPLWESFSAGQDLFWQ